MTSVASVVFALGVVLVLALICLFFILLAIMFLVDPSPSSANAGWIAGLVALATVLVSWLVVQALVDILRRDARFGVRWTRAARLARFAAANGMRYSPDITDPPRIGTIFLSGTHRRTRDRLSGGPFGRFEIGNYQYAGGAHERKLRRFGYLRLALPRTLPHMVLVSARNRRSFGRSNLPMRLPSNQVLSLEGDFDRHFTLHCPRQYEADALYVFTPDLMALLIDEAAAFDVEILDDSLLLYSSRPFDLTDPTTYELVTHLDQTLGAKASSRSERYRDDRSPSVHQIARSGRRLDLRVPLLARAFGLVALAVLVLRVVLLVHPL